MVLKFPVFFPTQTALEAVIERARKHSTLIIDLRANPGGSESSVQDLLGAVFEKDIKIADRVTREGAKAVMVKASQKPFTGRLIVLVDSKSSSASEIFARVLQLEKRGAVIGDRTAGRVMEAQFHAHQTGSAPVYSYGVMVSEADLKMSDGNEIEGVGVTPDELMIPTASDLSNGRDPVLARALEMAGFTLTAEGAGQLFPYEWPKP